MINMGKADRALRFTAGLFLLFLGIAIFKGSEGNSWGILITMIAVIPIYLAVTGYCFVYRWLKVHSLTRREISMMGHPYNRPE